MRINIFLKNFLVIFLASASINSSLDAGSEPELMGSEGNYSQTCTDHHCYSCESWYQELLKKYYSSNAPIDYTCTNPHIMLPKIIHKYLTSDAIDQCWNSIEYAVISLKSNELYAIIKMIINAHCMHSTLFNDKELQLFTLLAHHEKQKGHKDAHFIRLETAIYDLLYTSLPADKKDALFTSILKKIEHAYRHDKELAMTGMKQLLDNSDHLDICQYNELLEYALSKDRRLVYAHASKRFFWLLG